MKVHKFGFIIEKEKLKKGLCDGVKLDVYFPGFPTLKHLEHTVSFKSVAFQIMVKPLTCILFFGSVQVFVAMVHHSYFKR